MHTHGKNRSDAPVDPSCGGQIEVRLYDMAKRHYDPVRHLTGLGNNPECGTAAQPGFDFDMTWVFLVPPSFSGAIFGFADRSDPSVLNDPTFVLLPDGL